MGFITSVKKKLMSRVETNICAKIESVKILKEKQKIKC
jgi:hypothetical protein